MTMATLPRRAVGLKGDSGDDDAIIAECYDVG